jgi:hypothetical protein
MAIPKKIATDTADIASIIFFVIPLCALAFPCEAYR